MAADLTPELRTLAAEPAAITHRKLWRVLTTEERTAALFALLREEDDRSENRGKLIRAVARARHFREQTIQRWPDEKLAAWAAKAELSSSRLIGNAMVAFHLTERTKLLTSFLDQLAVPHDAGKFREGMEPTAPLSADSIAAAANALLGTYDADQIALYLLALRINCPAFENVDPWLIERAAGELELPPATQEVVELQSCSDPVEFTTLDRRLIQTVIDARAGIVGAASEEEVDDLLLEIEQLNASRHATFFHAGFRDSLFDRPPAFAIPAENEARRRWYWAGYVTGLARRDSWPSIVALFEDQPTVRELGAKRDGPTSCAADLVFSALARAERYGEAAGFAQAKAVEASPALRATMLEAATELLRRSRANEARALLEVLWGVVRASTEADDPAARFAIEVTRRRALCLRQLGEREEALKILRELTRSPDVVVRAIAHTDIGLIQAGYRRLGDMALPKHHDELSSLLEALRRGEEEWKTAVSTKGFSPAHANFALGVLALAEEKYDEADHRLGSAVTVFGGKPEIYSVDGSLALARLYHGVSICLTLQDPGRLAYARELIDAGLMAGAKLPRWLSKSTVDALAMQNGEVAREAASAILEHSDSELLDALIADPPRDIIPAIRPVLFRRAASPSRSAVRRVRDYRIALPWLIEAQELDRARDALGYLETAAAEGIGGPEFLAMLQCPGWLSPAWNEEQCTDARVHMLELDGRWTDASAEIEVAARRLLSSDDPSSLDNAELLLLELERYGDAGAECLARLQPIVESRVKARARDEAEAADDTASPFGDENVSVRILVVGGNEVQARMDASIQATIREELPGVCVGFLHSGWSGNWAEHVAQFDREVARADGVVLLQLMRTMFGRTIRARCHLPWRGCRGRGQGEIVNTIKRVVPAARARFVNA